MNRLADRAKHLVTPDGAVATAWPSVRDTCHNLGWTFDAWQDDLGRLILSKDSTGLYASSLCAMSLPRQVGKTYLIGCIAFALCLTQPGTTVIWTAHRGRTATETFRAMKGKAKAPELAAFIDQRPKGGGIRSANGEQEIEFLNGSRILFGARDAGFGVGFANVGMLVLDEVQRATTKTMDDLLPTTNAAVNPLVLCMGTPPRPTDDGEVFTMLRTEAITGESADVLYVELGADGRFDLHDDDEFWRQLRKVNPAFPHRVGERAILRNKKGLADDSVYREVFGLWDEITKQMSPIPPGIWRDRIATAPPPRDAKPDALGLDRWFDGTTSVAAAWKQDESTHVELVAVDVVDSTGGIVEWLADRAGRRIPVMIVADSPGASLAPDLRGRGVKVRLVSAGDYARACGGLVDDAIEGRLTHADQEQLNMAVSAARQKDIGKAGAWGWDRARPDTDISGLVAATIARSAAVQSKPKTGRVVTA